MAYSKNYGNPEKGMYGPKDIRRDGLLKIKKLREREPRRQFTKKQKAWLAEYQRLCFDLEPMYMDDYKDREMSFDTLQKLNIQWTRDHFAEIISNLEGLS